MTTRILFVSILMFAVGLTATPLEDSVAHLKKLDSERYGNLSIGALSELEAISLVGNKVTDEDLVQLTPLCSLQNIQTLDFRFNRLTGKGLKAFLEECKTWDSIIEIDLGGNPLVDEHLTALNAFPNLKALNIDFHDEGKVSQVTGDFFRALSLKHLSQIWATGTSLSDETVLSLLDWPAFEVFNFHGTPLKKETLEILGTHKVDMTSTFWTLKRIQFEANHPRRGVPELFYNKGAKALDRSFSEGLMSLEAYQWGRDNDIRVLTGYGQIMGVVAKPERAEDL